MITVVAAALFALAAAGPSDRLVDAGGVKLHLQCDGERRLGAPLVVLEAGAGQSAKTWYAVFGPIAKFTRVCAYDRAGLGTSERAPQIPTFAGTVETLHTLLRAADEAPPYVLAGHSYGGALVRFYTTRYPSEVTGLVLVDSTHEDQQRRFDEAFPQRAAPAGLARSGGEIFDPDGMAEEMARSRWSADMPLVVLTPAPADRSDARAQLWLELQRELASRSPQSEFIVATNSGHFIQLDDPPLVIDAVRRVVAKAGRLAIGR